MKYLALAFFLLLGCEQEKTTVEINPPLPTDMVKKKDLDHPWKKQDTVIIIDAYEKNPIDWEKMAQDKKVVAVIHRSAIGLRVDSKYSARKAEALKRGYLWGAYHLGKRGDVIKQADLFILQADNQDTLMVLDLEDTSNSTMMDIDESVQFMEYVYKKTGKIPVVYANHSVTLKLNEKLKAHELFKKSKLWYARFKGNVTDFPIGIWDTYFMWQFSSEINCSKNNSCLYNVPGTLFDMDVNVFDGTKEELKAQWRN